MSLAGCSPADQPAAESSNTAAIDVADTVYTNGRIYTVNEAQPWAEAVAIEDGKFLAVGSADEIADVTSESTEVINLQGAFAMPGIGDSHIHPALVMPKRAFCGLPGTFYEPTEEQILDDLKKCIANYPEDRPWFIAAGYTVPAMSPETLTKEFLDELIPDKPAYIEDESGGHNAWFNTPALEAAGLTPDFEDSPEGYFSRTENGELAGMAYEGAVNLLLAALPDFDTETRKVAYMKLLDEATAKGITAIGEGYVFEYDLEPYAQLHAEGRLNQHINLYLKGNLGTAELTPVETLLAWWNRYDLPGQKGVKIGMGGGIDSGTEPLVDGYADPSIMAETIISADVFADYVAQLDEAGFQVKVHAIGDGTVRATLDGYEILIKANGNNRLRHHIDHCSLIHPDDFPRFVDLDVTCTMWPPLNAPVGYNIGSMKPMLKSETWARMYPNRDAWDAGVKLVNHTDAPAAVLWPWYGMEAAVTRRIPGNPNSEPMHLDQALTVEEMIIAYTTNVAWSLRMDDQIGSIEEGKWADMIALNHNLFEIPATDIHKTEVQKTIFKGEVVYSVE